MENRPQKTVPQNANSGTMRTITLEEHFATQAFLQGPGRSNRQPGIVDRLLDLGEKRIAEMDAARIDMQVLSLNSPGVEQLEADQAIALAGEANERLAQAVKQYPTRFAGLATLPTPSPARAVAELEHAVKVHGFKGAAINGHVRGRYLDDSFFWPILECAESLKVPIYLHPTPPPQKIIETYYSGNYPPEVAAQLSGAAWGWHIETAIHVLRIILSGAFDRYPNLQVVIGHLGETLPFMLPRLNNSLPVALTRLKRPMGDYLRRNLYYSISGFNFTPAFLDLLLEVGAGRIMFSADYPYGSMEAARTFLEQLPLSPADKERIAHVNAEILLGL